MNCADALSMLREGLDMRPQLKSSQVSWSRSLVVREWYCGVNSSMRNVMFGWRDRFLYQTMFNQGISKLLMMINRKILISWEGAKKRKEKRQQKYQNNSYCK